MKNKSANVNFLDQKVMLSDLILKYYKDETAEFIEIWLEKKPKDAIFSDFIDYSQKEVSKNTKRQPKHRRIMVVIIRIFHLFNDGKDVKQLKKLLPDQIKPIRKKYKKKSFSSNPVPI